MILQSAGITPQVKRPFSSVPTTPNKVRSPLIRTSTSPGKLLSRKSSVKKQVNLQPQRQLSINKVSYTRKTNEQ